MMKNVSKPYQRFIGGIVLPMKCVLCQMQRQRTVGAEETEEIGGNTGGDGSLEPQSRVRQTASERPLRAVVRCAPDLNSAGSIPQAAADLNKLHRCAA